MLQKIGYPRPNTKNFVKLRLGNQSQTPQEKNREDLELKYHVVVCERSTPKLQIIACMKTSTTKREEKVL